MKFVYGLSSLTWHITVIGGYNFTEMSWIYDYNSIL